MDAIENNEKYRVCHNTDSIMVVSQGNRRKMRIDGDRYIYRGVKKVSLSFLYISSLHLGKDLLCGRAGFYRFSTGIKKMRDLIISVTFAVFIWWSFKEYHLLFRRDCYAVTRDCTEKILGVAKSLRMRGRRG